MGETKKRTNENVNVFKEMAVAVCNGCDLVTGEENKLSTGDVTAHDTLTISDFALCEIDGKEVAAITFEEEPGKYYWGGLSLTNMVLCFIEKFGDERDARMAYADESDKIKVKFEMTKTKAGHDFVKVTVL